MSRSKHSSWRVEGEERKERSLLKETEDWKTEALEELSMAHEDDTLFVILNEWEDIENDGSIEIVGGSYFATEQSAWDHLDEIADTYDVELSLEDTSFDVPAPGNLNYESYYIMELKKYDEGA